MARFPSERGTFAIRFFVLLMHLGTQCNKLPQITDFHDFHIKWHRDSRISMICDQISATIRSGAKILTNVKFQHQMG